MNSIEGNSEIIIGNQMTTTPNFTRPQSFKTDEIYFFRERNIDGNRQSPIVVRFLNYAPCPAIVIIDHPDGSKQRCLRGDLFELRVDNERLLLIKLLSLFRRYSAKVEISLKNTYCKIWLAGLNFAG